MDDEAPPGPVFPGDLAQITEQAHAWRNVTAIVAAVHSWGIHALLIMPSDSHAETRFLTGSFEIVGAAALMPPAIAKAREEAMATAALIERERN